MSKSAAPQLADLAAQADRLRELICEMCLLADSGHPSSSLSCVDLISVLFFKEMKRGRGALQDDVFILSKGHAAPALSAALMEAGDVPREWVSRLRAIDSPLQGHPDVMRLPYVAASTGALGQGLSMAVGRAQAMLLKGDLRRSYCVIGDGESQEGQIWEAALYAGNQRLPNLVGITDRNGGQSDGKVDEVSSLGDLANKWRSFGWFTLEVDGHDLGKIAEALERARNEAGDRPTMLIANTLKGYISPELSILGGDHAGKITAPLLTQVREHLRNRLSPEVKR
jgi:transketolase